MMQRLLRQLKERLPEQAGFTLMEVLVGIAILVIVLGAVSDLMLSAWRQKALDDDAFAKYADTTTGMDWFTRDARVAAGYQPFADGDSTLTLLRAGGGFYRYAFDPTAGTVSRTDETGKVQVVARQVSALSFYLEDSGLTIQMKMQVDLRGGGNYEFISHATLRTRKPGT